MFWFLFFCTVGEENQVLNSFLSPAFKCWCIWGLLCVFLIFTLHRIFDLFKNGLKTWTSCVQPAPYSHLNAHSVPLSISAQSFLVPPRLHRGCSVQNGLDATSCCSGQQKKDWKHYLCGGCLISMFSGVCLPLLKTWWVLDTCPWCQLLVAPLGRL